MDPHQLKALADKEFDRSIHRKNLLESARAQMMVPFGGGLFLANPATIAYLSQEESDLVYLEDIYNAPIRVNRQELLTAMREQYQLAMKAWYDEYQSSNRIRRAQNV